MEKDYFLSKFKSITDPNTGKNAVDTGLIEGVEVNADMKRVYVTINDSSRLTDYIEKRVRDIVNSSGYDPEIVLTR